MQNKYNFSVSTDSKAVELVDRLSSVSHYRLVDASSDGQLVHARVGSRFLLRMIGVNIYDNYVAPVDIEIKNSSNGVDVQLSGASGTNFLSKGRVQMFYEKTFQMIESRLTATDSI